MTEQTYSAPETRDEALTLFERWIRQRPGLDPREYGDGIDGWRAYRNESAHITQQRHRAGAALRRFEWRTYDRAALATAFQIAFSGRLSYNAETKQLDYTTGQYWPTEYRLAAAVVLERYLELSQ